MLGVLTANSVSTSDIFDPNRPYNDPLTVSAVDVPQSEFSKHYKSLSPTKINKQYTNNAKMDIRGVVLGSAEFDKVI